MRTAESMAASLVPYRLRTIRIGVQTTALALIALFFFHFGPGNPDISRGPYVVSMAIAAAGVVGVALLPWRRLFQTRAGIWCMYAWSSLDIVLITIAIGVSGGARSELFALYGLTTVFFAASYPRRGQVMLACFTSACYVVVLVSAGSIDWSTVLLRLSILGVLTLMGSFLARELIREVGGHEDARRESEHRAASLALVAAAGRSMTTLDSDAVLDVVAESCLSIGFEAVAICVVEIGEEAGTYRIAHARGLPDAALGYRLPADKGIAGCVRRQQRSVIIEDHSTWADALDGSRALGLGQVVGTPIWSGSEMVAVLIAGAREAGTVSRHSIECLELLAGQAGAALGNAQLFAERHAFQEQLTHQAFHDPLTNLANRSLFRNRVEHALDRKQGRDTLLAAIFLDLDDFKTVNDSLGHAAGDAALVTLAQRLQACLRPGDTAARLGGDEFGVLCEDLANEAQAAAIAERIADAIRAPLVLFGHEVALSASLGVAFASHTDDPETLIRNADVAMYRAKEGSPGSYELFDEEMRAKATARVEMERALRRAIENEELRVYFQPKIKLETGAVVGVEALARWDHPDLGLVMPDRFIPLAEETGLIVPLGMWVLRAACRQAASWQAAGRERLTIAVNLSARQLADRGLGAAVAGVVAETGLDPSLLCLEITETVFMEDPDATVETLDALRALGVQISVDDFGTGYSSLIYLRRFPVEVVKVDRSFVAGLGRNAEDTAIVAGVITMSHALDLDVVAEGVETFEQAEALRMMGCEMAQGYFWSRPVDADAMGAWLDAWGGGTPDSQMARPLELSADAGPAGY
jgi:diguanylate cyclase (GGDEF)-like protein